MVVNLIPRELGFTIQLGHMCNKKLYDTGNQVNFYIKADSWINIAQFIEVSHDTLDICKQHNETLECTSYFDKPVQVKLHICVQREGINHLQLGWFQDESTRHSTWLIDDIIVLESLRNKMATLLFYDDFNYKELK